MKRNTIRNSKFIYKEYISKTKNKYKNHISKRNESLTNYEEAKSFIIENKDKYKLYFNIEIDIFINNINNIKYKHIDNLNINPKVNDENEIFFLKGYLKSLKINHKLYSYYNTCIIAKKELQKIIDYDRFKFILDNYNLKLSEVILKGNKKCNLGFNIGIILIKEKERYFGEPDKYKTKFVNWKESNENKQRLIENRELPYNKKDEEIAKELGVEYRGVKWLVYHNEDVMYWWCWNKNVRLRNKELYSFTPTEYKNTKQRNLEYILNLSENEILKHSKLGNKNKLFAIMQKNSHYKTLYKSNYGL